MTFSQNSEIRALKSGIPKMCCVHCKNYALDALPRSPKSICNNSGPFGRYLRKSKQLGTVFDMNFIQNSELRVFKSGILQKIPLV